MVTTGPGPEHLADVKSPARVALAAALATMLVAGCAGTANPTASPTELAAATPSPTVEPTAAPTAAPTASPTPGPTLIPYPGPSIPAGTLTLKIAAKNIAFDTSALTATANTPFVIAFDNNDPGEAHNVAIKLGSDLIFNPLPTIVGPAHADYYISAGLPAGTYAFLCIVHPVMHGTLTVT
jgi:plastocyanin